MGGDVENCTGVVAAGVTAIIEDDDEAAEPSWFSDRADEDELREQEEQLIRKDHKNVI